MTTPTPTVYQSRSRTNRRRFLIAGVVVVLVLAGFAFGRLAGGKPAASAAPASSSAAAPSAAASPAASPSASLSAAAPGPAGVDAYQPIQAEDPAAQNGVEFQDTADTGGGRNAGWIAAGDWLRYDRIDFGDTPATQLVARVASGAGDGVNGRMDIRLDDLNAAPVGSLPVHNTGDWQKWISQATDIAPTTGVHTVFLTFAADRGDEFINLNYITFEHSAAQ
jgi:carbohydrate binding protein with CBM6 domain